MKQIAIGLTVSRETIAPRPSEIAKSTRARVAKWLARDSAQPRQISPEPLLSRIETFAATLALWGSRTNLTAHPDDPDQLAFHIIDSLAPIAISARSDSPLRDSFAPGRIALDVGSGAGFPGLVLAAASDAHFVLAESRRKRANFLRVASAEMNLANVEIDSGHASASRLDGQFDLVLARAIGNPPSFYRLARSALRANGLAILFVAPSQRIALTSARDCGLLQPIRIAYDVPRGSQIVNRVLAIFRRS